MPELPLSESRDLDFLPLFSESQVHNFYIFWVSTCVLKYVASIPVTSSYSLPVVRIWRTYSAVPDSVVLPHSQVQTTGSYAAGGGFLFVHCFPKLLKFLQSESAPVVFASCMTTSTTYSGSEKAAQFWFSWPKSKALELNTPRSGKRTVSAPNRAAWSLHQTTLLQRWPMTSILVPWSQLHIETGEVWKSQSPHPNTVPSASSD